MHTTRYNSPRPSQRHARGWLVALALTTAMVFAGTAEVMRVEGLAISNRDSELARLTEIIGELGEESMERQDRPGAERVLTVLHKEPRVRSAAFFDSNGTPFATYDRDGHSPARVPVRAPLARSTLDQSQTDGNHLTHVFGLSNGGIWVAWEVDGVGAARNSAAKTLLVAGTLIMALIALGARIRRRGRAGCTPNQARPPSGPFGKLPGVSAAKPKRSPVPEPLGLARVPDSPPVTPPAKNIEPVHERPAIVQDHSKGVILLVEDHPLNRRVTAALLERHGYSCETACHGAEALEILDRIPIDLILMDCRMPVMDGFEATHRIRQDEQGTECHIPIIAMTAGGNQADRDRCSAAGMDDFVPKPMEAGDLERALALWLPTAGTPALVHAVGARA